MGPNTSKIKDIIFVTSEQFDPPEMREKKKSNPHKEMRIDYKTYTPRKYYLEDISEEQIQRHLQQVDKKQNLLKQFKHYKDFDRIDYKRMNDQAGIFQIGLQEALKMTFASSIVLSRVLSLHYALDYFTISTWRRLCLPCLCLMIPPFIYQQITSPDYHIVNHEYFRMLPDEEATYVELDQKLNAYKDVEDMKYNFKYRSVKDYYKTRRYIHQSVRDANKNWYKQMYLYDAGLKVNPIEEFAKARQNKRVGNWEILSQNEKIEIQKELQERKGQSKI